MTKIHLEKYHIKILYAKFNFYISKKCHHYKNQFLENHAYCYQYFIHLS